MQTSMILDGRYKLLHELGKGSEGTVYLVFQESTFRFYAAKQIKKDQDCFSREGLEVWKRLCHKNLPEIQDVYETEDTVWIIMEYIDGMNLEEMIRKGRNNSVFVVFKWVWELCEILEYLHNQNPPVIFGDLKPENIMIRDGNPVMIDLGSAYLSGSKAKRTGSVRATEDTERAGEKKDIYCLGLVVRRLIPADKREWSVFVKNTLSADQNGYRTIGQCKKELHNIFLRFLRQLFLLLGTVLLLGISGLSLLETESEHRKNGKYEEVILEAKSANNEELLIQAIRLIPENKTAYLEYIDYLLEDLILSKNEYRSFLNLWNKCLQDEETVEDLLMKNPNDYAAVVYRMGLACWYFYQEREGTYLALQWFEKLKNYPPDLQKNCDIYRQIGQYRNKLDLLKRTKEQSLFFREYLEGMHELKSEQEGTYFRLLLFREEMLFAVHYIAELQNEGMKREELTALMEELQKEIETETDQSEEVREEIGELEELLNILEEMIERFYEEDGTDSDYMDD